MEIKKYNYGGLGGSYIAYDCTFKEIHDLIKENKFWLLKKKQPNGSPDMRALYVKMSIKGYSEPVTLISKPFKKDLYFKDSWYEDWFIEDSERTYEACGEEALSELEKMAKEEE